MENLWNDSRVTRFLGGTLSLLDYEPLNDEDRPVLEQIEINLKKVEVLVLECAKNTELKNHALIRLFEAGVMCKESIKRSMLFDEESSDDAVKVKPL